MGNVKYEIACCMALFAIFSFVDLLCIARAIGNKGKDVEFGKKIKWAIISLSVVVILLAAALFLLSRMQN